MKNVFVVADNIVSPVGNTAAANFYALNKNISGIKEHVSAISPVPYFASLLTEDVCADLLTGNSYTKFEQLIIFSARQALQNSGIDIQSADTIFIISSTKGNISLLEKAVVTQEVKEQIGLSSSARKIAAYFKLANTPLVVSNACISGLTALLTGKRLLESGQYQQAVVVGADIVTEFILSGFESFQAISRQPCRPFDAARDGINLGEAAATIILSLNKKNASAKISGGAVTNDANHISGPSRSGQELCMAINKALKQAQIAATDIGFISAHGTATIYNDEMEAKAFSLAGMETIPLNSLKGYYGHTLGAAGVVESVIAIHSLQQKKMIATRGFTHTGVSKQVNVCASPMPVTANHCLKTASGFGGCNAALVFSKVPG